MASSSFADLLLQIDSMVISGMIGSGEASSLRKKVMDSRSQINDAFCEIRHKTDMELLSELRLFTEKMTQYACTSLLENSTEKKYYSFDSL